MLYSLFLSFFYNPAKNGKVSTPFASWVWLHQRVILRSIFGVFFYFPVAEGISSSLKYSIDESHMSNLFSGKFLLIPFDATKKILLLLYQERNYSTF